MAGVVFFLLRVVMLGAGAAAARLACVNASLLFGGGGDDDGVMTMMQDSGSQAGGSGTTNGAASNHHHRGLNNVLMQLRKCCNHPYLFRSDAYRIDETMIRCSGKFLLLDGMLPLFKAGGHRVLLFSQMTAAMDLLEEFFTFRGYSFLRLDGSTPADERERRVAQFNDPCSPTFVFLLSTRAGKEGINLVSANRVVLLDSSWNPANDRQALFRSYRFGQKKQVHIYRLVAQGFEDKIRIRATQKEFLSRRVVDDTACSRIFNGGELDVVAKIDDDDDDDFNQEVDDDVLFDTIQRHKTHVQACRATDSVFQEDDDEKLNADEQRAALDEFEAEQQGHHDKPPPQTAPAVVPAVPAVPAAAAPPPASS